MLPDWVSNPGPLTYESGALPIALCGPAHIRHNGLSITLTRNTGNQNIPVVKNRSFMRNKGHVFGF